MEEVIGQLGFLDNYNDAHSTLTPRQKDMWDMYGLFTHLAKNADSETTTWVATALYNLDATDTLMFQKQLPTLALIGKVCFQVLYFRGFIEESFVQAVAKSKGKLPKVIMPLVMRTIQRLEGMGNEDKVYLFKKIAWKIWPAGRKICRNICLKNNWLIELDNVNSV